MIALDAESAGCVLGVGTLRSPVTGVSIDSRTLQPGDLFVALRGERFDGHDFVEAALELGASGAVVEEAAWRERAVDRVYQVADTLQALGALAREVRRVSDATVFAITGSVGKTSTKDILAAMVGRAREVVATTSNQNNEIGVPLTLFGIEPDTQAVVVEMGMRGLGQISELAIVAEPGVGVITNVHPVHLELLGSLDQVARAKAELLTGIRVGGTAVIPADCSPLEPFTSGLDCRVMRFGVEDAPGKVGRRSHDSSAGDVVVRLELNGDTGHMLVVRWPEGEARVHTGYLSRHALENAAAAAAACYAAGLPMDECLAGVEDVQLSAGRGQMAEVGGLVVIDDTYNANPAAVRAAVDDLVRLATERGGRAVAVLGDMLELGPDSPRFHEQVGVEAAAAGVSVLWGVGPMSEATVRGFVREWQDRADKGREWTSNHVGSYEEAEAVVGSLRPGDIVLVKGSRGVQLENVVIKMVGEGKAGRWSGGAADAEVDNDSTGEKRHC